MSLAEYVINPYVGAGSLRFGMDSAQVAEICGLPDAVDVDFMGDTSENRGWVTVGYKNGKVFHIGFGRGARVIFSGRELFGEVDPIGYCESFDPDPLEWVGFLYFMKLGIRMSGFHDGDESGKTISVFCKGRYDEYREQMKPFKEEEEKEEEKSAMPE